MVKSKKVKKKEHTETWFRKKCVEIAKNEAKKRDKYTCQRCGRSAKQGYQIHGSHIKNEGLNHSMSADLDNIIAKCAQCHMWWHAQPDESGKWFREKYPDLAKELDKRAQKPFKVYWKQRYEEMKTTYNYS